MSISTYYHYFHIIHVFLSQEKINLLNINMSTHKYALIDVMILTCLNDDILESAGQMHIIFNYSYS